MNIRTTGLWLVALLVSVLTFRNFAIFQVDSGSMLPTLKERDYLFVFMPTQTLRYMIPLVSIPRRQSVVVISLPGSTDLGKSNDGQFYVKRVIGLPMERVRIKCWRIYVDGRSPDDPYAYYPSDQQKYSDNWPENLDKDVLVPSGGLYCIGG